MHFVSNMQWRYFGRVARRDSNSMEKKCMLGMMEGDRSRGRPRLRWTDNIRNLTASCLHEAVTNAQTRRTWHTSINDATSS